MPTPLPAITPICGRFRTEVGMTARSALRWPCRHRHGHRLLHVAGKVVHHSRRTQLKLDRDWPWSTALAAAFTRPRSIPALC
jgi:hypothetical protein